MEENSLLLFKRIFHEAHVVDIDFSKWDKFFRFVTVASAFPPEADGRYPSYQVDFCGVESFAWRSNHLDVELEEGQHCQFTVMDYAIRRTSSGYAFYIFGRSPEPTIQIFFRGFRISKIPYAAIRTVATDDDTPYGPLARPSIEELSARLGVKSRRGRTKGKR